MIRNLPWGHSPSCGPQPRMRYAFLATACVDPPPVHPCKTKNEPEKVNDLLLDDKIFHYLGIASCHWRRRHLETIGLIASSYSIEVHAVLESNAPVIALQARCESWGTSLTCNKTKTMIQQLQTRHEAAARAAPPRNAWEAPTPMVHPPSSVPWMRFDSSGTSLTFNTAEYGALATENTSWGRISRCGPRPRLWSSAAYGAHVIGRSSDEVWLVQHLKDLQHSKNNVLETGNRHKELQPELQHPARRVKRLIVGHNPLSCIPGAPSLPMRWQNREAAARAAA